MGCVLCRVRSGQPHAFQLECQRPEIFGESNWVTNLMVFLYGGIGTLFHMFEQRHLTASGDERAAKFAMEICSDCTVWHAKRKKQFIAAIRKIPEIDNVFREYPELRVYQVD